MEQSPGESRDLTGPERRALLRRLFRYLLRYRFRLTGGVILALLVSITNLFSLSGFVPIFNALGESGPVTIFTIGQKEKERHDRVIKKGAQAPLYERVAARSTAVKLYANARVKGKTSNETILFLCTLLLPIYVLKILAVIGTLYFIGTAGLLAVRDIRMDLYARMNDMGVEFYAEQQTGYIMSRIINDVELVGRSISTEFNDALTNMFYIITHVIFLAVISWQMFLFTFLIVPILMTPVNKLATRIRKAARGQQDRLADLGAHVQEILSGIRVIRAFSMERFERGRFSMINNELFQNTFRGHYYHQVGPALTELISTLVVVGFLAWGAAKMAEGTGFSRGEFFAFFFTLIFLMRPLKQVSIMVNLLGNSAVAAGRIFDMLDRSASIPEHPDPVPMPASPGMIEYRNVSLRYPGSEEYALRNVSLKIEKGKTVSLVGSSGAGKSSMMDLLPRFYDVSEGVIEIDGTDIRRYRLAELRTSIGIVTQSIFLFNASVRENIAYGRTDVSEEKIIQTARTANAHEFIAALPDGYDTALGERGVMLSGGQRQRIAIARALLRDPPILIFDEATSALDNESEKLVQDAMERLLANRTVFIIAHRLSTVYNSDEIIVLEDGQIAERGSHDQLLADSRIYGRLYEMQFSE